MGAGSWMLFGDGLLVLLGHSRRMCHVFDSLYILVVVRHTVDCLVLFMIPCVGLETTDIYNFHL